MTLERGSKARISRSGAADPHRRLPADAPRLVTSQGYDWLAGKAFLTAVRLTYQLCDSREPVRKALTVAVVLVRCGVVGAARVELAASSVSANGREPLCAGVILAGRTEP